MNPITYLCFTLMSILIQFGLMDFTNEHLKLGNNAVTFNRTLQKDDSNVLKRITQKPHALFYRTETQTKRDSGLETNSDSATTERTFITSDPVSTEIIVHEDNVSMIDDPFTTESLYTSTEYDNVTEITFLYKTSTVKPIEKKKTVEQDRCPCDLLYQICDINCCCDGDCTETERLFFNNCRDETVEKSNKDCKELYNKQNLECTNNVVENLFCVVKVNLPDKIDIRYSEVDANVINKVYKWHNIKKTPTIIDNKKNYSTGDPLLLLKNGKLYNIDLPSISTNNYCRGSRPLRILVNENIECNVKFKDLHGLQILKTARETRIVKFPNEYNSTTLNCSTVMCTNWTVIVCNDEECQSYNKELHDPLCSDAYCSNIAYKIEYMFYCNETGVISSTVKLYVKEVSTKLQLIKQHIHVRFLMTDPTRRIIKISGNPGYIYSLPIIASTAESNHTHHFYNDIEEDDKYLMFPASKQGKCVLNRMMNNKMQFGHNKRTNCRLTMEWTKFVNVSEACVNIQERITSLLRLNGDIFISPMGKPPVDVDWVLLKKFGNANIHGEYRARESKLLCYNIVTRFSITIVYVDIGKDAKENKIISANVVGSPRNMTLSDRVSYSVVVSVDVNFIDASAPAMRVYAGAPLLSINLPKNFFLPFH